MDLRVAARAGIVTALMLVVLAGAVPAPGVASAPVRAFFGMQDFSVPSAREFAAMGRGGVGTFRALFSVPLRRPHDSAAWAPYDVLMARAARERIEVLPVLLGTPGGGQRFHRPRTRAQRTAWATHVSAIAERYGPDGTFWTAHPELEPQPLRAYQVWNEPNLPVYWRPALDAAGYLRLVRLTRARVRRVDPTASIVLAGLPDSRLGTPILEYLRAIYAVPGARSLFDVVALNPYADDAAGVLRKLNAVRAHMDRRGDQRTPIWITEIGWGTSGLPSPFRTTKYGQAARVKRAFRALIAARERLRLERLIFISLQDRPYVAAEKPWWGPRVGLFDLTGRPKPAWRTFVGFTGGRPGGRVDRATG